MSQQIRAFPPSATLTAYRIACKIWAITMASSGLMTLSQRLPSSTIAALDALEGRVDTIILGGMERGYDFTVLGSRLVKSSVNNFILFQETGDRIKAAILQAVAGSGRAPRYFQAQNMQEAVDWAKRHTKRGQICLLSTASPSYNQYRNFEDKGEEFSKSILS